MAVKDVRNAIAVDLAAITTANGFTTNTVTVYKVPKTLDQVTDEKMPAFSVFLVNSREITDAEKNGWLMLNYAIVGFVETAADIAEEGAIEDILTDQYEDVCNKFLGTPTFEAVSGVESWENVDFFPGVIGNRGVSFIPMVIKYKL